MRGLLLLLLCCAGLCAGVRGGRVAVLLHGESFRSLSHQHARSTGQHGFQPQKEASLSHLLHLTSTLVFDGGLEGVDLHVRTYETEYVADLRRWYGPQLASFSAAPPTGDLGSATALELLAAENSTYDAVLVLRLDVIFKPLFAGALLEADRSKILFPFECGPEMIGDQFVPRVSDMFVWLPRAFFQYARDQPRAFINNHHTYQFVETSIPGGLANLAFILPHEMVDSDPEKMRNRIYRLADRPEKADWDPYMWKKGTSGADKNHTFPNTTLAAVAIVVEPAPSW